MKSLAEGGQRWEIPVSCLHEFLSVVSHPEVFNPASTCEQAVAQIDAWLASPQVCIENGVSVLWRADRDFGRFKALKTVNLLHKKWTPASSITVRLAAKSDRAELGLS